MTETVEYVEIDRLTEFSSDKPVRKDLAKSKQIMSQFACFEPGQEGVLHHHPAQDEIFYVIEEHGAMTIDDDEIPVSRNSLIFVPAGTRHRARANKGSRLVIMFTKCTSATARAAADPAD